MTTTSTTPNKAAPAKSIVKALPKIGDKFSEELVAFNKKYEEFLPKNLTYDPVTGDFQCGSYTITVGTDLATVFDTPSHDTGAAVQASQTVATK